MRTGRMIGAGLCAILVGIGMARFAYTPLIPVLIEADWFSAGDVMQLGAANLVGYLAGALAAAPLAARVPAHRLLQAGMLLASATFFASAAPVSFAWFFGWRFASGLAGGMLMALAAPTILPHIPPERRGLAGGLIFTGVGFGIAGSGLLMPLLLRAGLDTTWLTLGGIALALALISWNGWPRTAVAAPAARPDEGAGGRLWPLHLAYGLIAFGLVPHMVFLVDYVARGLGRGLEAGAVQWVAFGLGALVGPTTAGWVADRIGFKVALRGAFLIQAAAVAIPLASTILPALLVSSFVIGAFVPGATGLVLGRLRELTPPDERLRRAAWSIATAAFALGQAVGGYGLAFLYAAIHDHAPLFAIGAMALLLGLAVDLASAVRRPHIAADRAG